MGNKRYLIYFSYIGTMFKGVQRQINRNLEANVDPSTVQGLLEFALCRLRPKNDVVLYLSSRTDQGVHALKTAAAVDLEFNHDIQPLYIHNYLNGFFDEADLDIRVLDVLQVSKDFNPRRLPLWRKYIYRFATIKPDSGIPQHLIQKKLLPIPITENHRCYFVPSSLLDLDALHKASELFIGTKDFVSFMGRGVAVPEDFVTIRRINRLYVEPAQPFVPSPLNDYYNYWHCVCEGKSFLYKQIRKTVGVLLAVAQHKLSMSTVQKMIEDPSPLSYPKSLSVAPSHGLYLADVFYDPKDLEIPADEMEQKEPKQEESDGIDENMDPLERNKLLIKKRLEKYKENKKALTAEQ
ncbi:tRNA pseudouridine synthase-like 1 [Planococcus citri]|uniref:tRNA pseudouridine synthase-like 1 n=1 Tax=Planococcus citri TaxID=170843 RepID=UPI0031F7358B